MKVENVFQLQEALGREDCISIPWLQKELCFTYSEAKEVLAQLRLRGWVSRQAQGNRHKVLKENLQVRKIQRSEAQTLYDNVTTDWITAVNCVLKKANGATLEEIRTAVRDEEEVEQTVDMLLQHRLIYCYEALYFSCVGKKDASALLELQQTRRRNSSRRSILDEDDDDDDEMEKLLQELFDRLFGA